MIAEQEQYTCVQTLKRSSHAANALVQPHFTPDVTHNRLFEFAANTRVTLAERHPRLTVLAVSPPVSFSQPSRRKSIASVDPATSGADACRR